MYTNFKVEIPCAKGKTIRKKIKETTYIYYVINRVYLPEKKYTRPNCTTIGKVCDDDPKMMYPNEKYYYYFPEAEMPEENENSKRCEYLHVGSYFVLHKLISEYHLDEMLSDILGDDTGLFLDLALYTVIYENNVEEYYPDYACSHPLYTKDMKIYSDSTISKFIHNMDEGRSEEFLNRWNEHVPRNERIYVSYDSTNKQCQAGDIELAEYGNAKEDKSKPIFNYSIAYDCENKVPLFYETYPGSIVDVSQLQYTVNTAKGYGYENIGFILDRGYFSQANIRNMDENGYDFVIMVKGMKSFVKDLVLSVKGKFEEDYEKRIRIYNVSGITVKKRLFPSDKEERYFHIYYSDSRRASERGYFEGKINEQSEFLKKKNGEKGYECPDYLCQYFEPIYHKKGGVSHFMCARPRTDVINEGIKLCGYFVIITSAEMNAEEALDLYKSRDASEKLFCSDKSFLGNKSLRVYSTKSALNKIFIEFVALIIRNCFYTKLRERVKETNKNENYMTVPAAIRELEKIDIIRQTDGIYRMIRALTKTQKNILASFDLTERNIREKVLEFNDRLSSLSKK